MGRAKIIVAIIAIVVAVILVLQNTAAVETRVLFASVTMPLAVLLLVNFVIGIVAGLLIAFSMSPRRPAAAVR